MDKIDRYLETLYVQEDLVNLYELDMNQIVSKFTPEKFKGISKNLQGSINKKNPIKSMKKIKKIVSVVPVINLGSVDKTLTSKIKEYPSMKKMAKTVLQNSFGSASKQSLEVASSAITVLSMIGKKNEKITMKENLKKNIKEFITRTRKFTDEHDDDKEASGFQKEDLPDLAVAWVIITMGTAAAVALGTGGVMILAEISTLVPYLLILAALLAFILLILKLVMAAD